MGMEIQEHTAIKATAIAMYAMSMVRNAAVCFWEVPEVVFTDSVICVCCSHLRAAVSFLFIDARKMIAPIDLIVNLASQRLTIKFCKQNADI